jgi:hypothetical protein
LDSWSNERVRQESRRSLLDTPLDAAIDVDVITAFNVADDTISLDAAEAQSTAMTCWTMV